MIFFERLAVTIVAAMMVLCRQDANAGSSNTQSSSTSEDFSRPSGIGLNLFIAGDSAFIKTSSLDPDESSKQGMLFGGKGLLTLVNKDLEIEGGAGYATSLLQGSTDIVEGDVPGQNERLENVQIKTQSALAEFSARLRLNESSDGNGVWSIGPAAVAFLGTNSSFGPDLDKFYSSFFLGGQLGLEFGIDFKTRLILSYLTDINIHERQVHIGMLSLQFGTALLAPKSVIKDVYNRTTQETVKKVPVEKTVERTVVKENIRFLLDSESVNFETDRAILLKRSDVFLRELGLVLAQNQDRWNTLTIEGHTDSRGTLEHNNKLSLARASSVKDALSRAGVPSNRMKAIGFGPLRPIDPSQTEIAWARNRRVELTFEGVKDSRWLKDIIQKLKLALRSPGR